MTPPTLPLALALLSLLLGACGPSDASKLLAGKLELPASEVAVIKTLLHGTKVDVKQIKVFERRAECKGCPHIVYAAGHIRGLHLPKAGLTRLPSLLALERLERADLSGNAFVTLVSGCGKALRRLKLANNAITSVRLGPCPELRELDLAKNKLKTFPKLEAPRLERLNLSFNALGSLASPAPMPSVRVLNVDGTRLHSLEGVETYPRLDRLYARHNFLASLAPMQRARAMQHLYVDHNKLKSLITLLGPPPGPKPGAEVAPKTKANAKEPRSRKKGRAKRGKRARRKGARSKKGRTRTAAKEPTAPTPAPTPTWKPLSLRTLGAGFNTITSLEGLVRAAPRLVRLDLAHNQLRALPNLHKLSKLRELIVRQNRLKTLDSVHRCLRKEKTSVERMMPDVLRGLRLGGTGVGCKQRLQVLIADNNRLTDRLQIYSMGGAPPELQVYDFRYNLFSGVPLDKQHQAMPAGGKTYILGAYMTKGYTGFGSMRSGSRGSRYGGGGGYRSGK